MDERPLAESLNTATAKARLKELGSELEVASWVRKRPFSALLVAAAIGGVVARVPRNMLLTFLDVVTLVVGPEPDDNETTDKQDNVTT